MESFLEWLAPVWRPHEGQREFLTNPAKTKILACGRRWGKTDACATQVLFALRQASPTQHLLLAPTLDQAQLLFDRVLWMLEKMEIGGTVRRSPYPHLRLGEHRVMARSGHIGRALRGNEATHVVVDEAAFVPEELITEVASPMLATNDGYLTLISTPHGLNHFWRYFQMGQAGEHGFWSRTAPSSESPYVSKSFLEVQRQLISDRAYAIEYEAQFIDSAGCVFKTEFVERCLVPRLPKVEGGTFFFGVDWARHHDWTAVAVMRGSKEGARLEEVRRMRHGSWDMQIESVRDVVHEYGGGYILCDGTATQDFMASQLQKALRCGHVESLAFSNASKAKLIENLSLMIERGQIMMEPNPDLLREIQYFRMAESPSGLTKYGAASGYHDDMVIALALAASHLPTCPSVTIQLGSTRSFGP